MIKLKLLYVVICVFFLSGTAYAYMHKGWSAKELTEKADLIVIATPKEKSKVTGKSMILEGVKPDTEVVELNTEFEIKGILKGQRKDLKFTLVHYYFKSIPKIWMGGPSLKIFEEDRSHREYLMFLKDEGEGIYAPTSGQTDPGYSVRSLH